MSRDAAGSSASVTALTGLKTKLRVRSVRWPAASTTATVMVFGPCVAITEVRKSPLLPSGT